MLKALPDDIQRHIGSFLMVQGCLNLELSIEKRLFSMDHYKRLLYKEDYNHTYKFAKRDVFIETCRLGQAVYSTVRVALRHFVIRHKNNVSTREANRNAFEAMQAKESKVLMRRLEMIGFNSDYLL